ncbi:MAG: DUF3817 domain-containing protein [Solirubrobacterales bacterium]
MNDSPSTTEKQETIKQLDRIRWIAIADFLLLVPLVMNVTDLIDIEAVIPVLGSIHGAGFLALLYLCVRGVGEERWGWWFPAIVLVTLGPPGSLYGEHRVRGEL